MSLTGRRAMALRWTLVVALLVAASAVALWPRGDAGPGGQVQQSGSTSGPGAGLRSAPDVAKLRQQAALEPCPTAAVPAGTASATGGAAAVSPLAGVQVPCLGDGSTVELAPALAGRPVLLNVWSHTCEPCREELPVLQRYAAEPGAVEVLGVQVDGSPQAGLALLTALGVRMPSVSDPDGELRAALGAPQVLPLTYLVDPSGEARMVNPPVVFRSTAEVGDAVRRLTEAAQR